MNLNLYGRADRRRWLIWAALLATSALSGGPLQARTKLGRDGLKATAGQVEPTDAGHTHAADRQPAGRATASNPADGTAPNRAAAMAAFDSVLGKVGKVYVGRYLTDLTCKTDQAANVRQAIAAGGVGGELDWPAGCIRIDTGLVSGVGQRWHGAGTGFGDSSQYDTPNAPPGGTQIQYTPATGTAIRLVGSNAKVDHMAIVSSVARSAASGFQLGDTSGPRNTAAGNPESQALDNVRVNGFAVQIDVQSGEFWRITAFDLHYAQSYAMRVRNAFHPDSGDGIVLGGTIYLAAGATGLRHESGGGVRMGLTKILNGRHAVDIAMADGVTTSDDVIDRTNSFELQTDAAILVEPSGPARSGMMSNMTIDPQIAGVGAGVIVRGGLESSRIGGIIKSSPYGIILEGGEGLTILPGTIMSNIANTALTIKGTASLIDASAHIQCYGPCEHKVLDERSLDTGPVDMSDTRTVMVPAGTTKWLYGFGFATSGRASYGGATMLLTLDGFQDDAGAIAMRQTVNFLNAKGSVSLPANGVTRQDLGPRNSLSVVYDTAVAGTVRVGIRSDRTASQLKVGVRMINGVTASFSVLP